MATELKTDSWHRYVLYRNSDRYMPFAPDDERRNAVEAGKKFTASAYADVWARDAGLASRARAFLKENFHWHERLANCGTDLDVVQMLMDMVRGGSVVVIPEKPLVAGVAGASKQAGSSSFWGVEDYDPPRYASVQERYQAQLAEWEASATPWEEIAAMNDSINEKFMHAAVLRDPLGMLPLFARAGWISKYGLPEGLSKWGEDRAVTTPLGEAASFELGEGTLSDDVSNAVEDIAISPAEQARCLAEWEQDHDDCQTFGRMMGGSARIAMCLENARHRYNICMGYTRPI
ncbi:hypothetical protein [Caballeronia humi]|uniref:Uncharacterized protein n=1 Tax=Caballeronia humi TaxID=326474 RepID=A0A158GQG2_9BURK|nr:hypothetical protein [Caballeronia humi]SAL34394.1 hypothetical protein AWB65_02369 [Caballeronia humi]